ncbi:MAG: hypothetical protein AB7T59_15260 [Hyphomonadaceae bacterium]
MIRKFTSLLAAVIVALATFAPAAADARDRRGHGYYDGHHGGYYDHRRRWRDDDDDGEAVAAGVIGLVLGLAIGSMASQPSRDDRYYQRSRTSPCYDPCGRDGYYDQGYDPYYDDRRGEYERDYYDRGEYQPPQCTRRERQWDRYANRYVTVDVPC